MNGQKKNALGEIVIVGFALFSMFFGAGNVIFPPFLGMEAGSQWLTGFFAYFIADIGLAMMGMFALLRVGSSEKVLERAGRVPAEILMCAIILCIGPMVAIPRTSASTYEMAIAPNLSGVSPVVFSVVFFAVILALCIKESAVVDIVGKVLTPLLLVGLFAMSQVLVTVEDVIRGVSLKEGKISRRGLSLKDLTGNAVNFLRSSAIGTAIGIIPATGVSAATFFAYSEAKRHSKTPEMYGKGCLEGIAATESSNNAVCGGALIPLLTLGVPGDIITAIMLGALMIQGLTPGPLLFVEHPVMVYGIFAAFITANVLMLVCGLIAVRGANKITAIPGGVLMPIVVTLCAVGGFAVNNSTFDLLVVAVFGTVGYLMIKCDFPLPPLLLAMILEPIAESNFRRALSISQNDYAIFYTSPVACIILGISLFVLIKSVWDDLRAARKNPSKS